jgi:hypothetical protein
MKLGVHYLWFKLALVFGSLLGLWLLGQSIVTYYFVSQNIVREELLREARRQGDSIVQDAAQLGISVQVSRDLTPLLTQAIADAPKKIAWLRVIDPDGSIVAQAGKPVGKPISFSWERLRAAFDAGASQAGVPQPNLRPYEIRQTESGKVLVTPLMLRSGRRGFRGGGPDAFRGPDQTPAPGTAQTPERRPDRAQQPASRGPFQTSPPDFGRAQGQAQTPGRGSFNGPPPGPQRYTEIALYLDSANATFGGLLTSLIINCTAAVGLVASMVLLWFRFPGYVKGKHLEQQTELARQVQMDLMPPSNSIVEKLDFAAECVPAWQVGGDFYDVFANSEGRIAVCLGDVSGKGLPASVVVGLLLGAVRASDWMKGGPELVAASRRLNELLRTRTSTERFASLFWCFYEPDTKMLRYINAGHLPPMIAKRNGNGELKIERLEDGGPVLGVIPAADYHEGEMPLAPGDLIVMYSDGVVEATDKTDDQFGEERLMAIIRENSQKPAAEIRDEILRRVRDFLKEEPAQDDLTLVVARIRA